MALRQTTVIDLPSPVQITWLHILYILPTGISRLVFRVIGSRFFFFLKKPWLRLHGIHLSEVSSTC